MIELHRLPHQPGWRRQRPGCLEQAWKGCAEGGFEAAGAATGQLAQQGSGRLATGIQIKGLAEQAFDRLRPFRPQLAEPTLGQMPGLGQTGGQAAQDRKAGGHGGRCEWINPGALVGSGTG